MKPFIDPIDPIFRKMNDAFHEAGLQTMFPTAEPFCNLIVYQDGQILAAIMEIAVGKPDIALVKLMNAKDGSVVDYQLSQHDEIVSAVLASAGKEV